MDESKKKANKRKFPLRNRPSIATAISTRMKENIFKLQGVDSIDNLVIRNLKESIRNKANGQEFDRLTTLSGKEAQNKAFVRTAKRQQTYTAETSSNDYFKSSLNKNKNNIDFLSNAFVFQKGNKQNAFYKKKLRTTDVYQ